MLANYTKAVNVIKISSMTERLLTCDIDQPLFKMLYDIIK